MEWRDASLLPYTLLCHTHTHTHTHTQVAEARREVYTYYINTYTKYTYTCTYVYIYIHMVEQELAEKKTHTWGGVEECVTTPLHKDDISDGSLL
jgi:hypothetical protein